MKINMTLEVSDATRRAMAIEHPAYSRTAEGLVTRSAVVAHIQVLCSQLNIESEGTPDLREETETKDAIASLRALGWDDARIKGWLLKQHAMMHVVAESMGAQDFSLQPSE